MSNVELVEISPAARKELHKLLDQAIDDVRTKPPYRGEAHGRLKPLSFEGPPYDPVDLAEITVDVDIDLLLTAKRSGKEL